MKDNSFREVCFAVMLSTALLLSGCGPQSEIGKYEVDLHSSQPASAVQEEKERTPETMGQTDWPTPCEQTDFPVSEAQTPGIEHDETTDTPEQGSRNFSTPEKTIPILLSTKESNQIYIYYCVWSLDDGLISEPEEWLTAPDNGDFLVGAPVFWNGSGRVVTYTEPTAIAPGIVPEEFNTFGLMQFGSTEYLHNSRTDKWYFQYTNMNSLTTRIEVPALSVPVEYNQPTLLSREPHLADLRGDEMTLVYMVYDPMSMEGDLYYVTYNIHDETSANWGTVHVPLQYAVDIDVNWNFCRIGDSVYMSATDAILVLDLGNEELHPMETFETFRAAHPNYSAVLGKEVWEIEICGKWNDLLVVSYAFTDADGNERSLHLALDEAHIAGIMEYNWGDMHLYDGEMHLLNHEESFAGRTTFKGLTFPRQ